MRDFLSPKDADAARRAGEAIRQGVKILAAYPRMGRLVDDLPESFREWPIDFGDSGYVVRYHVDDMRVVILAVRHQKEAGFK
ncbi:MULTISPECIES: type II toxin-antitoxin system RelE/ParE family toxin [unclassified Sphingobium]|uniref:type II toxin-antitoxin system RelE/ParE family toxin n=1 Tax=unclassified Sphingobium TaxID=2611147 RepID=UPI0035A61C17